VFLTDKSPSTTPSPAMKETSRRRDACVSGMGAHPRALSEEAERHRRRDGTLRRRFGVTLRPTLLTLPSLHRRPKWTCTQRRARGRVAGARGESRVRFRARVFHKSQGHPQERHSKRDDLARRPAPLRRHPTESTRSGSTRPWSIRGALLKDEADDARCRAFAQQLDQHLHQSCALAPASASSRHRHCGWGTL